MVFQDIEVTSSEKLLFLGPDYQRHTASSSLTEKIRPKALIAQLIKRYGEAFHRIAWWSAALSEISAVFCPLNCCKSYESATGVEFKAPLPVSWSFVTSSDQGYLLLWLLQLDLSSWAFPPVLCASPYPQYHLRCWCLQYRFRILPHGSVSSE